MQKTIRVRQCTTKFEDENGDERATMSIWVPVQRNEAELKEIQALHIETGGKVRDILNRIITRIMGEQED